MFSNFDWRSSSENLEKCSALKNSKNKKDIHWQIEKQIHTFSICRKYFTQRTPHSVHQRNISGTFQGNDCGRNMSEEKSKTRWGLICAKMLPSNAVPQSNNLAWESDPIEQPVNLKSGSSIWALNLSAQYGLAILVSG